ncbi:MAG TPA: hypothetical protein VIF43_01640 [Patescibacteria group bacterium]|jgi:hypothetical protein
MAKSVDSPKGDWDSEANWHDVGSALESGRELSATGDYEGAIKTFAGLLHNLKDREGRPGYDEARDWAGLRALSGALHRELASVYGELAPNDRAMDLPEIPADVRKRYPKELQERLARTFTRYQNDRYLGHLEARVRQLGYAAGDYAGAFANYATAERPEGGKHLDDYTGLPGERRAELYREMVPIAVFQARIELETAEAARFHLEEVERLRGPDVRNLDWNRGKDTPKRFAGRALEAVAFVRRWSASGFDTPLTVEEEEQLATLETQAYLALAEGCVIRAERMFRSEAYTEQEEALDAIDRVELARLSEEERDRLTAVHETLERHAPSMPDGRRAQLQGAKEALLQAA